MSPKRSLERLQPLVASFAASDLTHLEMRDGEFAVELVRRNVKRPLSVAAAPAAELPAANLPQTATVPSTERIVHAELVGIVRMAKPAIIEGTIFDRDREVASIESLGVKTPVRSGGPGRVTRILVVDGDAIDYGQALFVVERV
jgi:acetyl-CoA carboxylase biotin carboxyl carrier protein